MSQFNTNVPPFVNEKGVTSAPLQYFGSVDTAEGSLFEYRRANTEKTLLLNASISASTAVTVTNHNHTSCVAWMLLDGNIPPGSSSVTVVLKLQAVNPLDSTRFVTIASSAAKSGTGTTALRVGPGLVASAGTMFADLCPRSLRVLASVSSGAASFGCLLSLGISFCGE